MTPENFCYWLQGYIELASKSNRALFIDEVQTKVVRDHLNMVFKKVTPDQPMDEPKPVTSPPSVLRYPNNPSLVANWKDMTHTQPSC